MICRTLLLGPLIPLVPLAMLCLWGPVSVPSAAASIEAPSPLTTLQEQAEFLAGIPLPRQSVLAPLQHSSEYRNHQKQLQEQWSFCRRVRYEAMQQWGREHLSQDPSSHGVLRYLFGGPDFLNAYAFFPDTRVMVLGGLEPVGDLPPPDGLEPTALGVALKNLDEALHTSLFAGYFITSEMKPQLAQGSFQGVVPVLFTELALTGNTIDAARLIRPFGSPGIQIIYHRTGGAPQTLYYFKADLSNGKECRSFLSWLGDLGPGASYLKAASYLLPLDAFSETRSFLLNTSRLILQDDSGIPYRAFKNGTWRIQLFGVYTDPLPIFKLRREPELEAAYGTISFRGPLPFGAGYHVNAQDANLLLATKETGLISDHQSVSAATFAAPAIPAYSAPTPQPTPVVIRRALPVPVKKALPVPIRRAIPVRMPTLAQQSQPISTAYSPVVPTPPFASTTLSPEAPLSEASSTPAPALPTPATTSNGKPID